MTRNQNALQSLNHAIRFWRRGNVGPGNHGRHGKPSAMNCSYGRCCAENRQAYNKYISDAGPGYGSTDADGPKSPAHTLPGVDFTNRDAALKMLPTIMGRF